VIGILKEPVFIMTKLFVYQPKHPEAKGGIVEYDILCATMRLTGKEKGRVRFITSESGDHFYISNVNKQLLGGGRNSFKN
jgi:hypothetical protein